MFLAGVGLEPRPFKNNNYYVNNNLINQPVYKDNNNIGRLHW